jgi:hypothetical protein
MDLASVREFSERGEAVGRVLNGAVVEIGGAVVAATVPDPRRELMTMEGGSVDEGDLVVRILKSDLQTRPAEQQTLRWRRPGETGWRSPRWRVTSVRDPEMDVVWVMRCIPVQ